MKSALIAVVPVLIVGVVVAAVSIFGPESEQPEPRRRAGYSGTVLLTTNRDVLEICIDTLNVKFSEVPRAISAIEQAWPEVAAHPVWAEKYAEFGPPNLEERCPGEPAVIDGWILGDSPSQYRLWLFVTDAETRLEHPLEFKTGPYAAQEILVYPGSDDGTQVSTALYLTPAELANACVVARHLVKGLGLERNPPDPAECPGA